ncbi:hypothetical protein VTI74DRAFT_10248 [Chaetomium olivicolor]
MCLNVGYFCPACGHPSGHSQWISCPEGHCQDPIETWHIMQACHFVAWSCGNVHCQYQGQKQQESLAELQAILEGKRAPRPLPWTNNHNYSTADDLDPNAEVTDPTAPAQLGDVADRDQADSEAMEIDPHLDPRLFHQEPTILTVPPAPAPDTALDLGDVEHCLAAQSQREIADLHWLVQQATAKFGGDDHTWIKVEDELLILLRKQQPPMSYRDISRLYLPRHPEKGCESRRSYLKLKHNR